MSAGVTLTGRRQRVSSRGLVSIMMILLARPAAAQQIDSIRIVGAGGGGSSSGFVSFNWNGPTKAAYGIYDHGCLAWKDEFDEFVSNGQGLVSGLTPSARSWQATLATARNALTDAQAKAAYADVKQFASVARPDLFSAGAATSLQLGEPKAALAQLLAGIEATPTDPDLLFNFAASLAQQSLPNESLAAIQQLRGLGKLPALPDSIDPEAALSYLTGYNEMRLGRLGAAKANFSRAISKGPFLNEAKHALALVLAHEGNTAQAKQTYKDGLWRFTPKQYVNCVAGSDDDVRPPIDDMFDTSMGIEGKLVDFWLPDIASDLRPFLEMMMKISEHRNTLIEPLKQRMIAMGSNPNPKFADNDTPYNAWAIKMTALIHGLDEEEPYVLALQASLDQAREDVKKVLGPNMGVVVQRTIELALTPGNHCREIRGLVSNAVHGNKSAVERYIAAQREYARVWYKMATGLNAKIGDAEWHEFNDVQLREGLEAMNLDLLTTVASFYGIPNESEDCPEPAQTVSGVNQPPVPNGSPCDQLFGDLKIGHSFEVPGRTNGPKISYEVGCDKIKADIQYDLLSGSAKGFGTAMGGIASIEIGRKGDYSVFAGARMEASGPLGASGGIKSGLYLEGDNAGVTEFGGRVGIEGKAGYGKFSKSGSDDMKFNLLPEPPTPPRGPRLKSFAPKP